MHRLLTLRTVPQLAPSALSYTSFDWNSLLRRMQQMQLGATTCPERVSSAASRFASASPLAKPQRQVHNRAAGSYMVLRGSFAAQADVAALAAPQLYTPHASAPLAVAASASRFKGYEMSCTMLSSEQVCRLSTVRHMRCKIWQADTS